MSCILVIAEQSEGIPRKIAGEVCSEGLRLAGRAGANVLAVTLGSGAAEAAEALGEFGIEKALAVSGAALEPYSGESWAVALAAVARKYTPTVILMGATSLGRDQLGRLATHLGVSPASDCTGVDCVDGRVRVCRPVYAGKALLSLEAAGEGPVVASLRPNAFAVEDGQSSSVTVDTFDAPPAPERRATLVNRTSSEGRAVDLQEAQTVVSGGRGLKDPETFAKLVEPLAEVLGAAVGASRAVVDAGWRPHSEQVGQTGKTVAPKLYIACGISGAIQHLAGMRTAGTIVAINKDPEAPIFKIADYGIVGDVEEVLPVLTEKARALLAE